ncbi:terminase small subunit [Metasolibacillus sp.]|uniref:terminase small subunit n=1 Tax=Metasolibacillus sp. TaxID=2703680 RepID=UPI0025FB7FF0|nr:terminase small subunit [Metasolibacillus sp.]MCT6925301.1 terminase small subunit [Metasolibacillus sp.]MCT6941469.1 terminase small subunit [Metasolibacillus sp.]
MARARDPRRDQAYEIYKVYNGDIKLKDIAEQLDISEGTVRGWKNKDKWDERLEAESNGTFHSKAEKNTERSVKKKAKKTQRNKSNSEANSQATVQFEIVPSDGLNSQQLLFCMYYTKYWNATKAYKKVYGCDYASAMSNGSRLLRNDKVRAEIHRLKEELANGIMLDARQVLQKYIDIAFADITDFIEFSQVESEVTEMTVTTDEDGNQIHTFRTEPFTYTKFAMRHSDEIDGTLLTALSKGKDGMFKVQLADKMTALNMLAKYTDLLDDNTRKQLEHEKLRAETDFAEMRAAKLRGDKKDTSMLDALVKGREEYMQMMKGREQDGQD